MNAEIYYFSGTGNSHTIAKDIALKLDARLIPVTSVIHNERIKTGAETIGIVYPVYFLNLFPLIIGRFLRNLDDIDSKYLFAVCNFGIWIFS